MPERIVVVGGVAGGMTAAAWARRQSRAIEITVIERGADISYSECGLPYVFSGQINSFERLIRYQPDEIQSQRDISVLTGCQAEAINISAQSLAIIDLRANAARKIYYDYLVIATGARALRPNIEGISLPGVFTLRHLPEARAIDAYLKSSSPRRAVIVGAGYVGIEMAEALRARGLSVTIVERSAGVLKTFSGSLADQLIKELADNGVECRFNESLIALAGRERVEQIITSAGAIDADMVILAVGIAADCELAKSAGLRLGASGAIAVKDSQQTSVPNIYAAGDCCEAHHLVSDRPAYVPLGTTANKQGRVAGINAAGGRAQFKGIVGTMAVKVFNLEAAATGLGREAAIAAGFVPRVATSRSISRAGYYPGAQPIDTEIIYDERTGRLLGAHMVGREGVAKRIDTLATALYARLRLEDLLQLDLSYAPPFAPVWDAIIYAARKAEEREE